MEFRELRTDGEIRDAFPVMSMLRDRIRPDTFLAEVRRLQIDGYQLYGGFDDGVLLVLAGVRRTHTLARGEHLFVDDLVTVDAARARGHGRLMMRWLADRAAAEGLTRIYLDSRATARGFYDRLGFHFLTGIPCWVDVASLRHVHASE